MARCSRYILKTWVPACSRFVRSRQSSRLPTRSTTRGVGGRLIVVRARDFGSRHCACFEPGIFLPVSRPPPKNWRIVWWVLVGVAFRAFPYFRTLVRVTLCAFMRLGAPAPMLSLLLSRFRVPVRVLAWVRPAGAPHVFAHLRSFTPARLRLVPRAPLHASAPFAFLYAPALGHRPVGPLHISLHSCFCVFVRVFASARPAGSRMSLCFCVRFVFRLDSRPVGAFARSRAFFAYLYVSLT